LLARIQAAFAPELERGEAGIVIATTADAENEALGCFAGDGVAVFAGSRDNIPLRHLQAAHKLGFSAIVSIDGDDILCALEGMRAVYEGLAQGAEGVKTEGLPFGMNAWGYTVNLLEESLAGYHDNQLETGWGRIFDFDRFDTVLFDVPGASDALRLTLDYTEDFQLLEAVIQGIGPGVVQSQAVDVVAYILAHDLTRTNRNRVEEYWANFEREREQELRDSAQKV
jgi:spore coat polysaccharide biosynthesis protein SpsF (cytidylyltransferase family)